jgi:hypothetical protein
VAFLSPSFTRSTYSGILSAKVLSISDLPTSSLGTNALEEGVKLVTGGSGVDSYALLGVLDRNPTSAPDFDALSSKFSEGVSSLATLRHVSRTPTAWTNRRKPPSSASSSNSSYTVYEPQQGGFLGINQTPPRATFYNSPAFYFHVPTAKSSTLVVSIYDEDVMTKDVLLSSGYADLPSLLTASDRSSSKPVTCTIKMSSLPAPDANPSTVVGAAIGASLAGPAGAVACVQPSPIVRTTPASLAHPLTGLARPSLCVRSAHSQGWSVEPELGPAAEAAGQGEPGAPLDPHRG